MDRDSELRVRSRFRAGGSGGSGGSDGSGEGRARSGDITASREVSGARVVRMSRDGADVCVGVVLMASSCVGGGFRSCVVMVVTCPVFRLSFPGVPRPFI